MFRLVSYFQNLMPANWPLNWPWSDMPLSARPTPSTSKWPTYHTITKQSIQTSEQHQNSPHHDYNPNCRQATSVDNRLWKFLFDKKQKIFYHNNALIYHGTDQRLTKPDGIFIIIRSYGHLLIWPPALAVAPSQLNSRKTDRQITHLCYPCRVI